MWCRILLCQSEGCCPLCQVIACPARSHRGPFRRDIHFLTLRGPDVLLSIAADDRESPTIKARFYKTRVACDSRHQLSQLKHIYTFNNRNYFLWKVSETLLTFHRWSGMGKETANCTGLNTPKCGVPEVI